MKLLTGIVLALAMFSTSEASAAPWLAEDSWRLTAYDVFALNPTSGWLTVEGKSPGSNYAVKLKVTFPAEGSKDYPVIRVLIVQGTTLGLTNTTWKTAVDLRRWRPPFPDHIIERIAENPGYRPIQPLPIDVFQKYKGVVIESLRWVGTGKDKKLRRSRIRIDFSDAPLDKQIEKNGN